MGPGVARVALRGVMIGVALLPAATNSGTPTASASTAAAAPAGRAGQASESFIERYTVTGGFANGRPRNAVATKDGGTVLFLRSGPRDRVHDLYVFDIASGRERVLFTAKSVLKGAEEHLSAEEQARRERSRQSARGIASFELSSDDRHILVPLAGRLFVIERETGGVRELKGAAGAPLDARFSPDGREVACVRDGDLYVFDVERGTEKRLTTSTAPTISNGDAEFVAQEEMMRRQGYWWSPDSRFIACQQTDVAGVEQMHIADLANPQNPPHAWPYPRAGRKNADVRLAIRPVAGGEPVWVEWDRAKFPYLVSVVWEPNAPLTIVVHDRRQHEARVLAVDTTTGRTKLLLRERDRAWVQFHQSVPRWRADGSTFLWASERSGAWQLELRARDGRLLRTLTRDPVHYRDLEGIDEAKGVAWIQAWTDPIERQLYAVPLDPGKATRRITEAAGEHSAQCSPGRSVFVEAFDGRDGRYVQRLRNGEGDVIGTLPSVAEEPPEQPNVEWVTLDPPLRMRASIVRPRVFAAGHRYPVIVHVYGGPYHQEVRATRRKYLVDQWFADHGYVVVSVDGRGTPGRGRTWERAIVGDLIEVTLADQVTGLRQLAARFDEMDMDHVGIYGWSFGGYFTAMAVMRHPEVFQAGIAGAPVGDWHDYDTYYTERYMGLPDENPKG